MIPNQIGKKIRRHISTCLTKGRKIWNTKIFLAGLGMCIIILVIGLSSTRGAGACRRCVWTKQENSSYQKADTVTDEEESNYREVESNELNLSPSICDLRLTSGDDVTQEEREQIDQQRENIQQQYADATRPSQEPQGYLRPQGYSYYSAC